MMHYLAASPMVQLFIICQGHSTIELWESRQLAPSVLTLINIGEIKPSSPPYTHIYGQRGKHIGLLVGTISAE